MNRKPKCSVANVETPVGVYGKQLTLQVFLGMLG
jgi:hypothetical protein